MGQEKTALESINAILHDIYSRSPEDKEEWRKAWNRILEQKKDISNDKWRMLNRMQYFEVIGMMLDDSKPPE